MPGSSGPCVSLCKTINPVCVLCRIRSKAALDLSPGITMGYLTEEKRSFTGAIGSLFGRGAVSAETSRQQTQTAAKVRAVCHTG